MPLSGRPTLQEAAGSPLPLSRLAREGGGPGGFTQEGVSTTAGEEEEEGEEDGKPRLTRRNKHINRVERIVKFRMNLRVASVKLRGGLVDVSFGVFKGVCSSEEEDVLHVLVVDEGEG